MYDMAIAKRRYRRKSRYEDIWRHRRIRWQYVFSWMIFLHWY
jgi:hypothetical protein